MLNHPPATACPDLDRDATSTSEATDVCSDAPNLQEVRNAIARLKNGWAGWDSSRAVEVCNWPSSFVVPAEWRDGIIIHHCPL